MTPNEFARLIGLLALNTTARRALCASALDLTRIEQQRKASRDEFWESVVAKLFNDGNVKVHLDLTG